MKALKIIILVTAIIMLSGSLLLSQINNYYAFAQSSIVWEPIWGTYATDAMVDEGLTSLIDIGFTFPYGSYTYTQVKISSNGWVNLGGNLTLPYYGNDLAALNFRPLLAPLWDDISLEYGAVQYATYGNAPHRVFYVQFLAAKWVYTATNEYNFMVRMHETGQVDFIYGPHIGTPVNASASIGINMIPGGSGNYFSILPGTSAQYSTTSQYSNVQSSIPSGTMYIFMPKTFQNINAAAINLNGTQTPMQSVVSDYTVTVGNAGTLPIANNAATAYLMRGTEVLASASVPSIMPGSVAETTLSWAPDTTGLMYLYAKVELLNDAQSLNDETFPFTITAQEFVGNNDEVDVLPAFTINCYPNPFKKELSINLNGRKSLTENISIFNLKGQLIRQWKDITTNQLKWDGTDSFQKPVSSGVYLVKARQGSNHYSGKILKL